MTWYRDLLIRLLLVLSIQSLVGCFIWELWELSSPFQVVSTYLNPPQLKPTQPMNTVVYSKPDCPACVAVKKLLISKGQDFVEIDLGDDTAKAAFIKEFPGIRSMPQVVINGQRVKNLADLQRL